MTSVFQNFKPPANQGILYVKHEITVTKVFMDIKDGDGLRKIGPKPGGEGCEQLL